MLYSAFVPLPPFLFWSVYKRAGGQIVRTDLVELRDLDLGGAPYGYTPFCDSNKEMEGFRFWKQVCF